jgi:hypothetical protein
MTEEPKRVREGLVVRKFRRGEEPSDDISDSTTVDERFAMVWVLSERIWRWTGRPFPEYDRAQMPVRLVRRNES